MSFDERRKQLAEKRRCEERRQWRGWRREWARLREARLGKEREG